MNIKDKNKEDIIFQNSKKYVKEGDGFGKGILYCGEKYTNNKGCSCGTCDGQCGPNNGCPCPDCEYTLSYILYSTGKMKCGICDKTLLRINIFNLLKINPIYYSNSYECNVCHSSYQRELLFIPMMHCIKCNYNMCPECAFSKIIFFEENIPKLETGSGVGKGIIYCKKNYIDSGFCLCRGCDGNCGPDNGCPCPLCDSILSYNLYSRSNNMRCSKCNYCLIRTTIGLLKKKHYGNNSKSLIQCNLCSSTNNNIYDFQYIYQCYKCKINVCQFCAFDKNIIDIKNISFPNPPICLSIMEKKIKEKIMKEKIKACTICRQKGFKVTKKRDDGKNIIIYLKKLIGSIYTINIKDSENIRALKGELRKIDNDFKEFNTLLIWNNKILDDDEYICDYKIGNESVINILLKSN